ncbi:NUMOD4 domain-containing protein [Bacillus cereus]|uniref:NUMOD4 domain-containing protein n=1 Tax=Bacillus cereus TaxID=1396 RepID=UPI0018F6971F|nr:NUMOD4 domain-containing protein [Bacillus cereus]MBJ8023716.1 NUMOD4 motif-containing HNH endonuclease [Bacillus cereus]
MESVIWKDVVGYEPFYQVSNTGEIRSKDRKVPTRNPEKLATRKGRILIQMTSRNGYKKVSLTRNVKDKKQIQLHRLVALAFIPNPESKPFVNHIDGDKTNNHVSNLEWVTEKENAEHASEIGLLPTPWNKGLSYSREEILNAYRYPDKYRAN